MSSFKPHGKHLISSEWVASDDTFLSEPALGNAHSFFTGTPALVDRAVKAAEDAFLSFGYSSQKERAAFLNCIADEIEGRADAITQVGSSETGLPKARLQGERGRTTGQLRFFADHILKGAYLDKRADPAMPERQPLARPELHMVQRPIGPVAIFGASNFPLAFSTAGGDTASALAAGCPVVVKGHPAHPGTSEIIAEAIDAAIKTCNVHPGVFSLIQGDTRDIGHALVKHPLINAVGFTGSLGGGRALYDLCAARPTPIPFFGELGSINPMFLLPQAIGNRGQQIATGWAMSLTAGAGQFCTNPGISILIDNDETDNFVNAAKAALEAIAPQIMLTNGIAAAYRQGQEQVKATAGVHELVGSSCEHRNAVPYLYETDGKSWLENNALAHEVFGPLGIIIRAKDFGQMLDIARSLEGQLTCTLHLDDADIDQARQLMPILERKAGRVLANGFPTGVEVCDTMVHGGPYPASTNFGATSVGSLAIRRWLRPVCYQNLPQGLLPQELQS